MKGCVERKLQNVIDPSMSRGVDTPGSGAGCCSFDVSDLLPCCTANTHCSAQQQQLHCKDDPIYVIPDMKLRGLVPNFHIHVTVSDLYSHNRSTYFAAGRPTVGIFNRSHKHEFGNWEWGRAVSFLGIFVSNFRYSVFAVCSYITLTDNSSS